MSIIVLPRAVDFGSVLNDIDDSSVPACKPECVITLNNCGIRDVAIQTSAPSVPGFSWTEQRLDVPRRQSRQIVVRFDPPDIGKHSAILRLTASDPMIPPIEITLKGEYVWHP